MADIPRRIQLDKMTTEEVLIFQASQEVEKLGAHSLLTEVVILLAEARSKLADWVDRND